MINNEKIMSKVNSNYKVYKNSSNFVKISVESNVLNENEDKQRQCFKQLKCFWPKCRFSCNAESDLNRHISHHLNKKQFVCEECNEYFSQLSGLLIHKQYFHSIERHFVCPQNNCNKRFKTNSDLTKHKLRHSSVKSFGCNKCDKRFKTKGDLFGHKSVHTNDRPFVCPQSDCNQRFKRKRDMLLHKRRHIFKPFNCEKCNKSFSDNNLLISHKNSHLMENLFKCDHNGCDKTFNYKYNMKRHKRSVHIGIKTHKCLNNNCDKSFVTSAEPKRHIAYKHSTDKPF